MRILKHKYLIVGKQKLMEKITGDKEEERAILFAVH